MNAKHNTTQHIIALDAHPLVIGHATQVDTQTIAFDHHHYCRTGKTGHSMHDSTPVAEYRTAEGHTVWVDSLNRVHADTLDEARERRVKAIRQGAHEVPVRKVHRIEHTRLQAGDALYDAEGRKVDEVLYFTYGMRHSERIVHTRAGYAHATQGGYLLGLSNRQPE
ncbi:hypothetical protein NOV72_05749 [Caballeronia novacaledonica]|uniref:Uncharacterized protein n=1 Tax=Caballeronia novacaledonica TaxID=1544861 RepID=A0A2U3IE95_9BURK|nr:hypothetical protein [Caballeronia novacaledonica]SPB18549.1 hypothetical protein NOV72_05749 [Caballeronia novacaledonica]